ncbi:hypothetical protein FT233_11245 [Escherichia coli]|nr:hypothetical protein [Escherichia coli]
MQSAPLAFASKESEMNGQISIVRPGACDDCEMAGEWIVSEPEELHIPLPYGPQGLIYNRYVQKEAG